MKRVVAAWLTLVVVGAGCTGPADSDGAERHRSPSPVTMTQHPMRNPPPLFPEHRIREGVQYLSVDPASGCDEQVTPDHPWCRFRVTIANFSAEPADHVAIVVGESHMQGDPDFPEAHSHAVTARIGSSTYRGTGHVRFPASLPPHGRLLVGVRADVPFEEYHGNGEVSLSVYSNLNARFGEGMPFLRVSYIGAPCMALWEGEDSPC